MMGGNVCNYLFQIVAGNLMEVESYAQVNTVLAIVSCPFHSNNDYYYDLCEIHCPQYINWK